MTACDLIISKNGDIVFVQDTPFEREITRVEFYVETGSLILVDDLEETRLIEAAFTGEDVMQAFKQSTTLLLTHIDEKGAPQDGFQVPVIVIRP